MFNPKKSRQKKKGMKGICVNNDWKCFVFLYFSLLQISWNMQASLLFLMPSVFFFFLKEGDNNKTEHMIVVGPRTGISRITNVKTYAVSNFDFKTHTLYLTFIFMTFNIYSLSNSLVLFVVFYIIPSTVLRKF